MDEWIHGVFYTYRADFNSSYWDAIYSGDRGVIRDVTLVMDAWKEKDGDENEYQMCRVLRAYLFHRMTDLYEDIPYSDAAQGEKGILNPKYDLQQDIQQPVERTRRSAGSIDTGRAGTDRFPRPDVWRRCGEMEKVCQLPDVTRSNAPDESRSFHRGDMGKESSG